MRSLQPRCLAVLALALPLAAQAPEPRADAIRHDATTLILPAGSHALREVVAAVATFLERNILMDEREMQGAPAQVELQTMMQLNKADAEDVVSDLLYARGYVLVARDAGKGLYDVISLTGQRSREALSLAPQRTPEQILARPNLKQPVTTVLTLQRLNANIAVNALRPFLAQQGPRGGLSLGTTGNGTIVLSGIQADVARALEILKEADDAQGAPAADDNPDQQARIKALEQTVAELQQRVVELEKRLKADR